MRTQFCGSQMLRTKRFSTQTLLTKRFGNQPLIRTQFSNEVLPTKRSSNYVLVQNRGAVTHPFFIPQHGAHTPSMSTGNQVSTKGFNKKKCVQNSVATKFYAQNGLASNLFLQKVWQPDSSNKILPTKQSGNQVLLTI